MFLKADMCTQSNLKILLSKTFHYIFSCDVWDVKIHAMLGYCDSKKRLKNLSFKLMKIGLKIPWDTTELTLWELNKFKKQAGFWALIKYDNLFITKFASLTLQRQPHKMVKHTQTIIWQRPTINLSLKL